MSDEQNEAAHSTALNVIKLERKVIQLEKQVGKLRNHIEDGEAKIAKEKRKKLGAVSRISS